MTPGFTMSPRFIPACAGNPCDAPCKVLGVPVHPRVRGEPRRSSGSPCSVAGSSPRARGTQHSLAGYLYGERFIPACAGNPLPPMRVPLIASVHPRVRGEPATNRGTGRSFPGSSPRARGTQINVPGGGGVARFIPACAGNPSLRHRLDKFKAVHPRVRGEPEGVYAEVYLRDGSSPRARGTLHKIHGRAYLHRFIPACAGNPT